jgi:hypothetical protein
MRTVINLWKDYWSQDQLSVHLLPHRNATLHFAHCSCLFSSFLFTALNWTPEWPTDSVHSSALRWPFLSAEWCLNIRIQWSTRPASLLPHSVSVMLFWKIDCLCGLVVRVLGYRSGGPGSILGTTRKKSSGSGTGCTQPREYKLRSYLIEK